MVDTLNRLIGEAGYTVTIVDGGSATVTLTRQVEFGQVLVLAILAAQDGLGSPTYPVASFSVTGQGSDSWTTLKAAPISGDNNTQLVILGLQATEVIASGTVLTITRSFDWRYFFASAAVFEFDSPFSTYTADGVSEQGELYELLFLATGGNGSWPYAAIERDLLVGGSRRDPRIGLSVASLAVSPTDVVNAGTPTFLQRGAIPPPGGSASHVRPTTSDVTWSVIKEDLSATYNTVYRRETFFVWAAWRDDEVYVDPGDSADSVPFGLYFTFTADGTSAWAYDYTVANGNPALFSLPMTGVSVCLSPPFVCRVAVTSACDGLPLRGATVTLSTGESRLVDLNGVAEFDGLTYLSGPSSRTATASLDGYTTSAATTITWTTQNDRYANAITIALTPTGGCPSGDTDGDGLEVLDDADSEGCSPEAGRSTATRSIIVTATDGDGAALAGATVTVNGVAAEGVTGADGTLTISGVPMTALTVVTSLTGYPSTTTYWPAA